MTRFKWANREEEGNKLRKCHFLTWKLERLLIVIEDEFWEDGEPIVMFQKHNSWSFIKGQVSLVIFSPVAISKMAIGSLVSQL